MRRIERGLQLRLSLCGLHTDAWASAAIFSALIRLLHLGQQPLALLSRRLACPYPRGLCAACSSACCCSFSRFSFASWAWMCLRVLLLRGIRQGRGRLRFCLLPPQLFLRPLERAFGGLRRSRRLVPL